MHRSPIDIIKTLMNYGIMVPITQSIDFDTAAVVGEDLGISVKPEQARARSPRAAEEAPSRPCVSRSWLPRKRRIWWYGRPW